MKEEKIEKQRRPGTDKGQKQENSLTVTINGLHGSPKNQAAVEL